MTTWGLPNAREGPIHAPKESSDGEHDYAIIFYRTLNWRGLLAFWEPDRFTLDKLLNDCETDREIQLRATVTSIA